MLICIFQAFLLLNAAEMVVTKPLVEVPGDLTLRQSPKNDLSGNPCALVKINTDLLPFMEINSNRTPVEVVNRTGEVWVYLSPGDKRLYFEKEDFARFIYDIPVNLQSNMVYTMTIMGKGIISEVENVVTLTFSLNIEGVVISREGKAPITAKSTIAPFRLPRGNYNFTFEKQGYKVQTREVNLQDDETVDIAMETGSSSVSFSSPGIVTIESDPSGAEVELNGQKVGVTPYQGSHYAGEYTLTLRKDLYHPASKTFSLNKGETLDITQEKLKPRFGYWQVTSTPNGANIYLDEKHLGKTPLAREKIPSGEHSLRLTYDKYKTHQETFIIKDGDESDFDIELEPNFASLVINSAPENGAAVFIDDNQVGVTPFTEKMMQAGTYTIRIEKELWSGSSETITIYPEVPLKKTLYLTKDFGTLRIEAPECQIYLDGKNVGANTFEQKLKPGNYAIKATQSRHHDDEKNVYVGVGETIKEELSPIPMLGSISVFAVDKRNPAIKIKDAEIFINNEKSKKRTPAVLELLYGEYDLKLKHADYLDESQSVNLKEGDTKNVTFELDTYSGSVLAKKNAWKRNSWLGFTAGVLLTGGGFYCNMQSNDNFDKYESTGITAEAMDYKQKTQDFENYRDCCYYAASGAAVYTLFCWIKTAVYGKKLREK
ncbi:MAG: PEGA domain-containing protein [Candidatus Cloacimonetes bacterium]|nr:PEGA domain-containing protein [Candidatus Cloacimonadota bacterium]